MCVGYYCTNRFRFVYNLNLRLYNENLNIFNRLNFHRWKEEDFSPV